MVGQGRVGDHSPYADWGVIHLKSAGMRIRKPKERGEWAELLFMARAAELGYKLSKPWGDSAPYDVAIELRGHFVRVQVKSTMCKAGVNRQGNRQKGVYVCNMRHISVRRYLPSDFDILAVYVIPRDIWYIIPSAVATRRVAIRVAPGNPDNQYERYREAWHLVRDQNHATSKTPHGLVLHAVAEPWTRIPSFLPLSSCGAQTSQK